MHKNVFVTYDCTKIAKLDDAVGLAIKLQPTSYNHCKEHRGY